MSKIPQQLRSTCDENLVINLPVIISNLIEDPTLEAVHTVIRSRYNDDAAKVTFAYIEREVTSILADREKVRLAKLLKSLMTLKTKSLQWPHFTLRKRSFNHVASLLRVNLARLSLSQPVTNTESPDQHAGNV